MDGVIHPLLAEHGVSVVGHVPDAGHTALIQRCERDPAMSVVTLTTEEEGIALAAGAWLGGARSAVLMQSSGVGNCCNLLGLPRILAGPLLLLVTMRGEWGEENPWQLPAGQAVPALLETCGVIVHRADHADDVAPAVRSALGLAFASNARVAVLLGQRLLGAKAFEEASQVLDRRAVVRTLLADRGELVCVAGLGGTAWDVAAAGGDDLDLPLWGAMGGAAMLGLGIALAQPERPVLVVTGDGEQLMALGALATIAGARPANLTVAVLDNERYGETGSQVTHTALGTDLAAVAAGCGIADARTVRDEAGVAALRDAVHARRGPCFAAVKITPDRPPLVLPPRDGALLARRLRAALGVE